MLREGDGDGCLFCRIVAGDEPAYTVWEDSGHIAFLTPFPNTPGFTVVATRAHLPSYGFALDDAALGALCRAAKQVGLALDRALGTHRTGLIMEGMGIDHAHIKLAPMHGIEPGPWRPMISETRQFFPRYVGYIASNDGPEARPSELRHLQQRIRAEAETGSERHQ